LLFNEGPAAHNTLDTLPWLNAVFTYRDREIFSS